MNETSKITTIPGHVIKNIGKSSTNMQTLHPVKECGHGIPRFYPIKQAKQNIGRSSTNMQTLHPVKGCGHGIPGLPH